MEKEKIKSLELQNNINKLQGVIGKLQSSLELERAHEEKVQAMTKESLETLRLRAKEWEEKYFVLHDQWQKDKIRIKDLERMKSEYEQMQGLLTNIRSFVGGSPYLPSAQMIASATPIAEPQRNNASSAQADYASVSAKEENPEIFSHEKDKQSKKVQKQTLFD